MPRPKNNISEYKQHLSFYFEELAYGIKNTKIKFKDSDELINFAVLDIVTALFYTKPEINQDRFISNLEQILEGIKRFRTEESNNAVNQREAS